MIDSLFTGGDRAVRFHHLRHSQLFVLRVYLQESPRDEKQDHRGDIGVV
jgi:hypothetical protein